ncbi:MAG TPA: hypothetical protein PLP19_01005 [bacterium]|nr:hypothetical protein [bacterium]HPN42041.1 hypothetical protein [bacterium]
MKYLTLKSVLFFILVVIFLENLCLGQIPQTISYQGILSNADGSLVSDGNYTLTFKLYDNATGGTILWSETQNISINNGIFNVILGSIDPLSISFNDPYWLGITVGEGSEFIPRVELTSSAYSLNTRSVANSAVTGESIANGYVVRSLNSLTDDVIINAGENVTVTTSDNTLTISATGGSSGGGWTVSGDNVYTTVSGNVGISTSTPAHLLSFPDVYGDKISLWGQTPGANCLGFGNQYRVFQMYTDQSYADIVFGWGKSDSLNETMRIQGNGKVGIGTNNPQSLLHLNTTGKNGITIDGDDTNDTFILMRNGDNAHWIFDDKSVNHKFTMESGTGCDLSFNTNGPTERMRITSVGDVGIGTKNPQGKLDVNGTIYQRGSVLHADYVFATDYQLESIKEHAGFMWENKHLKAIPKAIVDENGLEIVEYGAHQKGIVEELEKAHIYIEQLHERINALEEKIEKLSAAQSVE